MASALTGCAFTVPANAASAAAQRRIAATPSAAPVRSVAPGSLHRLPQALFGGATPSRSIVRPTKAAAVRCV